MGRSWEDRVAEYVDSPLMLHRTIVGKVILCEIQGSEGIYLTSLALSGGGGSSCTCPSEIVPCKHVAALGLTFKKRPKSFADAEQWLAKFATMSKDDLIAELRAAIARSPGVIEAMSATRKRD